MGYGVSTGRLEEKCGWVFCFESPAKDVFEDPGTGGKNLVSEPVGGFLVDLSLVEAGCQPPPKFMETVGDKAKNGNINKDPILVLDFQFLLNLF